MVVIILIMNYNNNNNNPTRLFASPVYDFQNSIC